MAFSFSNAVTGGGGFGGQPAQSGGAQVRDGPELQEIQTDELGFSSINGNARIRLLPSPWPEDSLPPPTSSLLSVASSKGFLAAAGPDCLVFTSTENVRTAFTTGEKPKDGETKPFQAEVKISVPRLSQVAFSADETVLVVSSQESGGLIAYQVDNLKDGKTEPALQISTNNTGLRALVPNPVAESAELFAVITNNGELLMADLKLGQLKTGSNGPVLMTGASCLSWSNRGKQLVVGLADGMAVQMKPDGTIVTQIPKSTSIPGDMHLSAVSWLENDSFFAIYTPNDTSSDGPMPSSDYCIISRQPKSSDYTFQRLPEVCPPFGLERMPSFHFITRLRNFPPHLLDLLVVSSTNSTDVSLLSKSEVPLSKEEPVTGAFTLTMINEDTRRAQLPLSESQRESSAIGVGLDLSSKDVVGAPIPSDPEIQQSATPLPNLLLLTHDGLLVSWWIVYNESIREKTVFSGLVSGSNSEPVQMESLSMPVQAISTPSNTATNTSGFGQSSFGGQPTFGKPAASSFGTPAPSSGFGTTTGSAFGTKTAIGGGNSSWTSTGFGSAPTTQTGNSGFGQPAFGSSNALGAGGAVAAPAFGASSSLGNRPSPFGQMSASSTPAFGQSGFGSKTGTAFSDTQPKSAFGATATTPSSGFASFSNAKGFGGFGATKEGENVFTQQGNSSFTTPGASPFVGSKPEQKSVFGSETSGQNKSVFGSGDGSFKVPSTFQSDGSAKDDLPKSADSGGFGFGGKAFDDLLEESNRNALSPTHDTEAEMDEKEDGEQSESQDDHRQSTYNERPTNSITSQQMVTPPSTIIQHKSTPAPPLSSLFGTSSQSQTTPVASQSTSAGFAFGQMPSTTPKETPGPSHVSIFGTNTQPGTTPAAVQKSEPSQAFAALSPASTPKPALSERSLPLGVSREAPHIKAEAPSDDESTDLHDIPEAPLPPDPTSKTSYSPGDTSNSSNNSREPDEAPLPPDFVPANKSAIEDQTELPDNDDEFSSDFEGSGEDVTGEISPVAEHADDQTEQLLTSPESSFGTRGEKGNDESPTGGIFTKVTSPYPKKTVPRSLFGEVTAGPIFPPPKPQESPRSPSPIRNFLGNDLLRPEGPRSFSAPMRPPALEERRRELAKSSMALQVAKEKEEKAARDQAHLDAVRRAQAQAEAEAAQQLEDDEDERLRTELNEPLEPSSKLDAFLPHQPTGTEETSKSGIPGQIEHLYQDINSMVLTLGINARTLSAFMLYQQSQEDYDAVPNALKSDTPIDALNQEWLLADISSLPAGEAVLNRNLDLSRVSNASSKLQQCQSLLGKEIYDLRSKLLAMRKSLHVRSDPSLTDTAPLSPEQAATQQDIRKSSTAVQTKLAQAEESLSILRAKLVEVAPSHERISAVAGKRLGRSASQKKPTVEAVTNTIAKMTSMAEKKSADIDVLESQLKRLSPNVGDSSNGSRPSSAEPHGTPQKGRASVLGRSTGSAANSVYHTPDSKFGGSVRSTPGTGPKGLRASMTGVSLVSAEDREKWQAKARRKREVAAMMREALVKRRGKA